MGSLKIHQPVGCDVCVRAILGLTFCETDVTLTQVLVSASSAATVSTSATGLCDAEFECFYVLFIYDIFVVGVRCGDVEWTFIEYFIMFLNSNRRTFFL